MCLDVTVDSLTAIMAQRRRSSKKNLEKKKYVSFGKKEKKSTSFNSKIWFISRRGESITTKMSSENDSTIS